MLDPNNLKVADAYSHWLETATVMLRPATITSYRGVAPYIIGPLLEGSAGERRLFSTTGIAPPGARVLPMLGEVPVAELTTARIRAWHAEVARQVSLHTANYAKKLLKTCLELAEEDFGVRTPKMPGRMGSKAQRHRKDILTLAQGLDLLQDLNSDEEGGLVVAFPFLTGARPGEQLALRWGDLDLEANLMQVRRTQAPDGTVSDFAKNSSSRRAVPLCQTVVAMLLRHRSTALRTQPDDPVFVGRGGRAHAPGKPLTYYNFRNTYWRPLLARKGLPSVTPHSARHWFISFLQHKGVEVSVVARLAGHANPSVTLSVYSHSFRSGQGAVSVFDQMFAAKAARAGGAPQAVDSLA